MKYPEEKDILSACAAIILATALDQGIKGRLSHMAYCYAIKNNIPNFDTPYEALLKDTFRTRVKQMPELMTDGKFILNLYCPHANALNELITLRNNLLHDYDDPQVFTPTSEEVRTTNTDIWVGVPIPKSLWSTVTLEQLRDYQAAVDIYFSEILYPETGEIRSGQIVLQSA
jgi:hypothetical protein